MHPSRNAPLRTLIADDEPVARRGLRQMLARVPAVEVVGECRHGGEVVSQVQRLTPDLLLLDVQMPEQDGFQALQGLSPHALPAVIFVTAHQEFALQAFQVQALDYLLKPVDPARLAGAVERVRRLLHGPLPAQERGVRQLAVRQGGHLSLVPVDDIDWIQAADNYVRLHVGRETHLLRTTMGDLLARLDPNCFKRIHRSTIVNTGAVRELEAGTNGEYAVILHDGTRLTMSRRNRTWLQELMRPRLLPGARPL